MRQSDEEASFQLNVTRKPGEKVPYINQQINDTVDDTYDNKDDDTTECD